jgi:hypothetical protein
VYSILLPVKNASVGQVSAHGAFYEGAREFMDVSFACQSCTIGASVRHLVSCSATQQKRVIAVGRIKG